jgi:molybdenum cofactor synthesis domain-containing protein
MPRTSEPDASGTSGGADVPSGAIRVAVLTISDAGARGERRDTSGDAIERWSRDRGYDVRARSLVPDETVQIVSTLCSWCDGDAADLVLTTGGTGLSPRDVTPEATRAVIDRDAPGIAERIRALSLASFPRAALSRGLSGVRKRTLVINLPGSPSGVRDGLAALDPIIDHAIAVLRADTLDHGTPFHRSTVPPFHR